MRILRLMLLVALSFASLHAVARQSVPIVDHVNVAIEHSADKPLTLDQVKQAIMTAPAPRPWTFVAPEAGKLIGTLQVRGKHTIVVTIDYSPQAYSIIYRDSINMNHQPGDKDAPGIIHPFYNRWVQELREAIHLQLAKTQGTDPR